MSSSVSAQQGGVIVVTQMYPSPPQPGVMPNPVSQQMCTGTSTISRAHPLALGTVQIMIGLMAFLLGVVEAVVTDSMAVISGFFVWGAGFYITAGSLTVAAGKSSNRCLMITTLVFNVIATVAAAVATILYAFDAVLIFCDMYGFYNSFDSEDSYYCYKYKARMQGLRGVLTVFHFLEFIVTIVVSAFVCKSTCSCCKDQPSGYIAPGNASMAPQAPPSYSAPATVVHVPLQNGPGQTVPPPYSGQKDDL